MIDPQKRKAEKSASKVVILQEMSHPVSPYPPHQIHHLDPQKYEIQTYHLSLIYIHKSLFMTQHDTSANTYDFLIHRITEQEFHSTLLLQSHPTPSR